MVFGWNVWAASVCEQFPVSAVVDDVISESEVNGVSVVRSSDIPKDAMVISAVVGARPISALKVLQRLGVDFLDYFSLCRLASKSLKKVGFIDGFSDDLASFRDSYSTLLRRVTEEQSRSELERVLLFKTTYDLRFMEEFINREREQYFEPFVPLQSGQNFFDVGCFDGATSLEFARRNPLYGEIHAFEPSPQNRRSVARNLSNLDRVFIHDVVLGSSDGEVKFSEDGSSSRVDNLGGVIVKQTTLDSYTETHPHFMKIDIEGAEIDFLIGARKTIRDHKPSIAIAAYHQADHMRLICDEVLSLNRNYEVFFRHYTEGFVESDLFFVSS